MSAQDKPFEISIGDVMREAVANDQFALDFFNSPEAAQLLSGVDVDIEEMRSYAADRLAESSSYFTPNGEGVLDVII